MSVGHGWKEWFPLSSAASWWEGNTEIGFGACLSFVTIPDKIVTLLNFNVSELIFANTFT